jgi:diguanylate cyclase (GGDEF)-like protein
MRIALVDQSRTIVRIVTELLEADGHQVDGFTDGRKALAFLETDSDIGALITSVQLESLSGIELCAAARHLAGSRRPLYIILMSSSADHDLVVRALDRGADDFIRKPPDVEQLRARLRVADRVTCMQRELIRYASIDSLSGLLNRREFFQRTEKIAWQAAAGMKLSAIMLDLDHFKRVNDTHGHHVGDRVIVAVAAQLRGCAGISGRLGGEEFCVLAEHDLAAALSVAEELRKAVSNVRVDANAVAIEPTASFGVAQWQSGDTIDTLLRRADIALYRAKDCGRNCVMAADDQPVQQRPATWRSVVRAGPQRVA